MRHTRLLTLAAASALAAGALAGCSSGSSSTASSPAPQPSTSEPSPIGGSVLPPVIVTADQGEVTAKVGDTIVFAVDDPVAWKLATSDPTILEVTDGKEEGGAVFNPGAKALAAGKATVTLTPDTGQPRIVIVTVDPA
jgi:hypothetical protein